MPSRLELIAAGLILLAGIAIGIAIGYLIWGRQVATITEGVAMPVNHPDDSLTILRNPGEKPRLPAPTTPPGEKTRIVELEVKPEPFTLPEREVSGVKCPPERVECSTVSLRLDTTRLEDGSHRVSVLAQGGEVLDAVDIPVGETIVIGKRPWAVGYERTPEGHNGIALERDIGNLRIGGTITVQDSPAGGFRVLWKF